MTDVRHALRLNDHKAQENYYQKIVDRWLKFCADTGNSAELDKQFAAMSIASEAQQAKADSLQVRQNILRESEQQNSPTASSTAIAPSPELAIILMAMRKLREAVVATSRVDEFAQRAYMFIIRTTILLKHWESYHAALLYLLRRIHLQTPLSTTEIQEFVGYYVLDLACRQGDLHTAYKVKHDYKYSDRKIDRVVHALVHDDWVIFWKVKGRVDGHVRALMSWSEEQMRLHALKCLARSYFTAEKGFVERSTDSIWTTLVKDMEVGWELDGDKVTIRRPKAR